MFQSTLPRGERQLMLCLIFLYLKFQSTLPRGERRNNGNFRTIYQCFNPRSRVGSDVSASKVCYTASVSIHAPAWGATTIGGMRRSFIFSFNPRSRVGSDHYNEKHNADEVVSIHAPAWGATAKHHTQC